MDIEEIERRAKNLKDRYKKLRRLIKDDPAKSASTMLHFYRRMVDEIIFERRFLYEIRAINRSQNEYFKDCFEKDLHQIIHDRMNERIKWQARLIEDTINYRKNNGNYKGEFTTEVILANAYNDIFESQYKEFLKENANEP